MAKILCVCISKERKTCSQNIHECEADLQGLVGDVHYGMGGRKQVSLLPYEKVKEYFEHSGEDFRYGRFGENLLVEGIDWNSIAEGNRFRCGDVFQRSNTQSGNLFLNQGYLTAIRSDDT